MVFVSGKKNLTVMHRVNARLSQRIAEEKQLLAEERWIIEALTTLKQQRNGLEIERLHIENLKATINKKELRNIITASNISRPSTQATENTQLTPSVSQEHVAPVEQRQTYPVTSLSQNDIPVAGIDEEMCNNETLNLSVTKSVFDNVHNKSYDIEEDEEERDTGFDFEENTGFDFEENTGFDFEENRQTCSGDEEDLDDADMEDCYIEMNMLMQPSLKKKSMDPLDD